uniref:Uncharacterized protein n=1 Tax=Anguilla anguilla TaxID=7936 RepID=A0A0E9QPK3_ANGAN
MPSPKSLEYYNSKRMINFPKTAHFNASFRQHSIVITILKSTLTEYLCLPNKLMCLQTSTPAWNSTSEAGSAQICDITRCVISSQVSEPGLLLQCQHQQRMTLKGTACK